MERVHQQSGKNDQMGDNLMAKCTSRDCKENPIFDIVYDAGLDEQKLTLCKLHYDQHEVFKKFIKSIEEIKN